MDDGDAGVPVSRRVLVFATFMWVCLFLPVAVPDELSISLALVEVASANFVAIISADLLWNQDEMYRITPRLLFSVSMITATTACVFFSVLVFIGTVDGSEQEEEHRDRAKVFYIGDSAYIKSLTLFVSISTASMTMLVGLIRRILNRAFFNIRYNNCVLGVLVLMGSTSGLSMTVVPSPWNVVVSRLLTWTLLTLSVITRRGTTRYFFAPLRDQEVSIHAATHTETCYYPTVDALQVTSEGLMNESEDFRQRPPIRMCNIISRTKYLIMTSAADRHSLEVAMW